MVTIDYSSIAIIPVITLILAWCICGYLFYRNYKKHGGGIKIWKAVLVLFVGLFSFSINLNIWNTALKLSILPLGVWILYFVLKRRNRWKSYRSFAWLGFGFNFIFIVASLVAIPFQQWIFPDKNPTTFMANLENAELITIHPSAKKNIELDRKKLAGKFTHMKQREIYSDKWFSSIYEISASEINKKEEHFPYQLVGIKPKWGSGLPSPVLYIEKDGKGILITTSQHQLYYRLNDSVLKEEH